MSDKPIVYLSDGHVTYRASMFGGCDRMLVAAARGYTPSGPPEALQAIFEAGHAAEEWLGSQVDLERQQEEVLLEANGSYIVGHIDGHRYGRIVEVKSQSPDLYDTWAPGLWYTDPLWIKYAWQVSAYMIATGDELELIRVRRPDSPGGHYRYSFHTYDRPFFYISDFRRRVNLLATMMEMDGLPECGKDARKWGCPFWQLHEERDAIHDPNLDMACENYQNAKDKVKRARADEDAAKALVLKVLGDRPDVLTTGGYSVKYTTYDVKEQVRKATTATRLTVTRSNDD